MSNASISVIIVAYNSRDDLGACLAACAQQLRPTDELIVVDNGSTDGSADFVAAAFPDVKLIRNHNSGYAGGNNRGAVAARGDVLVFLNPDTVPQSGAIRALAAPLLHDRSLGMTTACLVFANQPATVNACGNVVHYTGLTSCRGIGEPRWRYEDATDIDAVSGAACAIRAEVFRQLGGFDEQFFMYVEDTDLSLRVRLSGYRCRYIPQAVVHHQYQPGFSPTKVFYLDRNRHMMLLKNLSRSTYLRLLPGLLLSEVVTGGFTLLRGPRYWSIKPQLYRWLWRNRRSLRGPAHYGRQRHELTLLASMTHRLNFSQPANRTIGQLAAALFHPIFWMVQRCIGRPRAPEGV